MKINTNYNVKKFNDIQKNNVDKSKNARLTKGSETKQSAVLDSKLLSHLDTVKDTEVFRQDRVDAIKQQLSNGDYQIDLDLLADKFLEN
jgi:flagellar biosynthesis anti-sigma factor FlgM